MQSISSISMNSVVSSLLQFLRIDIPPLFLGALLRQNLQPRSLLFRKSCLRLRVRFAQCDGSQKEANRQPDACHARVEDPHVIERVRERLQDDLALRRWEIRDETLLRAGKGVRDFGGCRRGQHGAEMVDALAEDVLVDYCPQDDGDGGGDLSDKAECCGCGCHVAGVDVGLEGHQRRLEEWPHADAADDLVDDDTRPRSVPLEIDEEAIAECHEEEPADDEFAVPAGDLDQETGHGRGCG